MFLPKLAALCEDLSRRKGNAIGNHRDPVVPDAKRQTVVSLRFRENNDPSGSLCEFSSKKRVVDRLEPMFPADHLHCPMRLEQERYLLALAEGIGSRGLERPKVV